MTLNTSTGKAVRTDPPPLPAALKGESPLVKFFWAWLGDDTLSLSTREIVRLTGVSQPAVSGALRRLREIGFLEVVSEGSGSTPPTLRALGKGLPPRL